MKLNAATRQIKTLKESNKLLMGGEGWPCAMELIVKVGSLLAQRGTVVMVKEKDRRGRTIIMVGKVA